MKHLYLSFLFILLFLAPAFSQVDLKYYLPQHLSYDSKIPTPETFLGYQVGEWHVSHDQLVAYMRELDRLSDRITLEQYAKTYESRPLLLLTITSPQNQGNISQIKAQHRDLSDPAKSASLDIGQMPVVVWMGYSVHGNEASGTNASLLVAYYLAAAQDPAIDSLLNETIILLDPSFNPDGMNRFASWVNTHKSKNQVADPNSRELNEAWPGGRTNHYWFDLNRDWLYVQHPESQGRIAKYHEWKPNILTDHHEMGSNATFFFQPGESARINPLTPQTNKELTEKMGAFHAKALDKIGSLYFTGENYDDFYYGKGSTFPDVNGAVGILFEQASSRGHAQETINGVLKFPFAIRNHVTTSLSTLEAARALRTQLLAHQRAFYQASGKEASAAKTKAYVFGSQEDPVRVYEMLKILRKQEIAIYQLKNVVTQEGRKFDPEWAYVVPANQPKHRMIRGIFDKSTTFEDSLFYDISAWSLPLAFNMPYAESKTTLALGMQIDSVSFPKGNIIGDTNAQVYAYVWPWNGYYTPRTTHTLLEKGYKLRVATVPFTAIVNGKPQNFDYGTIMLPVSLQDKDQAEIAQELRTLADHDGTNVYVLGTGLTPGGIDFGSANFVNLTLPKVMLLTGNGVNSNDAGEVWHLLDYRFNMPPTLVDISQLSRVNLDKYNTILMVSGNYNAMGTAEDDKIKRWVQGGGNLITMTDAVRWTGNRGITSITIKKQQEDTTSQKPYALMERYQGAQLIAGAIFQARLDRTHPLAYGYTDELISVFRDHTIFIEKPKNAFSAPLVYTDKPLLSGYINATNEKKIRNTAGIVVNSYGRGKVITMADNPNFRAFWFGTNKLLLNAIFFAPFIATSGLRTE